MNRRAFVLSCFAWPLFAFNEGYWKYRGEAVLAKEEVYKITLKLGAMTKDIEFRWTLYKNEGLVVHLRYDAFPHQFVLYRNYQKNRFRLPLFAHEQMRTEEPFLQLSFFEFNRQTKLATLRFMIHPSDRDLSLIYQGKAKSFGFGTY